MPGIELGECLAVLTSNSYVRSCVRPGMPQQDSADLSLLMM
jgi:hypothetical protein